MSDVFISYSRKDGLFARKLVDALKAAGREAWVDWSSIPYSDDWWQKIREGIDESESFVLIISPDSLQSEICHKEITHARSRNKRIIPVLHRDILDGDKPLPDIASAWFGEDWEENARRNLEEIRRLNWLFMRENDPFEEVISKLLTTTDEDPLHIKTHTRLLLWAREWEQRGHNPANLLRGDDLNQAEAWLNSAGEKTPSPTGLHQAYIHASLEAEKQAQERIAAQEQRTRRLQQATRIFGLAGVVAVILAVGAVIAGIQASALRQAALDEQEIALELASAIRQSNSNASQLISRMNRLVDQFPDYAAAYTSRGLIHDDLGNLEQAIHDYSQAITLDPNYARAYNNRGWAFVEQGNYERAISDFTQAIALDPDYVWAYNNLGLVYRKLGDLERATHNFDQAIALDPAYTSAYNNRGLSYLDAGNPEQAISDFNQAIRLDPDNAWAYNNRGAILMNQGDFEQAISDYDQAIALDPAYTDAYASRGAAYASMGMYEQAISDFDQAIALEPTRPATYFSRGFAYMLLSNQTADAALKAEQLQQALANLRQAEALGFVLPEGIKDTMTQIESISSPGG